MFITLLIDADGPHRDGVHIPEPPAIPRVGDTLDTHHGLLTVTSVSWDIDTAPDRPKVINGVTIHATSGDPTSGTHHRATCRDPRTCDWPEAHDGFPGG